MVSAHSGFDSGYLLLYKNPPQTYLKKNKCYLFSLHICRGHWKGICLFHRISWVAWWSTEGSFPRWLKYMALTEVGGELAGSQDQASGFSPCWPLYWVLQIHHRMGVQFQEIVSQESDSESCQFFFFYKLRCGS